MTDIEHIQSQIDQKIDETLTQLKVEAVANIVNKLNKEQNLNNVSIELSVHEKHMRRDYAYDPKNSFEHTFTAQIQDENYDVLISLKNDLKDVFMFSMENRPTKFYMEVSFDIEKYNASQFVSDLINTGFFSEASNTKTPETLFAEVLIRLSAKGEYISGYSYQKPNPRIAPTLSDNNFSQLSAQELHDQLLGVLGEKTKENSDLPVDPNALVKVYKKRI